MPSKRARDHAESHNHTDEDGLYYVRRKSRGGARLPDPPNARPFVVPPHIAEISIRPRRKKGV